MSVELIYETHAITDDNEAGIATGWLPGKLSAAGLQSAEQLGRRRRKDRLAAVFVSDLSRALETVRIAFGEEGPPRFIDWRLRECDYGELNGAPTSLVQLQRRRYLDRAHPKGESWRQAVARAAGVLTDIAERFEGRRVLVVGHSAQRFALDHLLNGEPLEALIEADFAWREGWEYRLPAGWRPPQGG